nr:capsule assembly Wzi family protein [Geotalea uraniireducens]
MKDKKTKKSISKLLVTELVLLLVTFTASQVWALASNNIPLDSPVYDYVEKLSGFGLIDSDVRGLRPYSRAEVARLLSEAEASEARLTPGELPLAEQVIRRLKELVPREAELREKPGNAPFADFNPVSYARLRYVHLNGVPRSYNRDIFIPGDQSVFGFIGGNLRPGTAGIGHESGTEGTPLLENNEGVIYRSGNNGEVRFAAEGYLLDKASFLVEPYLLATPENDVLKLGKGYLKIGSGGLELEAGRDANWFGPGRRGALTLSNNARNFDLVKLSSPEPVDVGWVKSYLGEFKYALILSRFDETGSGETLRQPWFLGLKLALKPKPWWEIGVNFVRQEGGHGFSGSSTLQDNIFGGGTTNHNNTIAGIDLRFRIPWLANTELYGEYAGEDSAGFWPFVESYVAGFYIPRLTESGRDDLRFEFFYGNPMLYTDFKFPAGYVYQGMTPGDSQGGGAIEFYCRYSHWFSPRNILALEYFRTDRGHEGRVTVNADNRFDPNGVMQALERKNAIRVAWNFPLVGDLDANLMYGWERIHNFNLVGGAKQTNQLLKVDLSYRY